MALYRDSDNAGVRIPALGVQDSPLYQGGFMSFAMAVVVAGDDTGSTGHSAVGIPSSSPAATSDGDADIVIDTQAAFDIFNIEAATPENVWIPDVSMVVETAFTASVTMTLGDTDDALGYGSTVMCIPTSTTKGLTIASTAALGTDDVYIGRRGLTHTASSAHIGMTVAGADPLAGRLAVFASYARVHRLGGSA